MLHQRKCKQCGAVINSFCGENSFYTEAGWEMRKRQLSLPWCETCFGAVPEKKPLEERQAIPAVVVDYKNKTMGFVSTDGNTVKPFSKERTEEIATILEKTKSTPLEKVETPEEIPFNRVAAERIMKAILERMHEGEPGWIWIHFPETSRWSGKTVLYDKNIHPDDLEKARKTVPELQLGKAPSSQSEQKEGNL